MAYNVISCQKVAENTQILKIAKFAIWSKLPTLEITQNTPKNGSLNRDLLNFLIGVVYNRWYLVISHVQTVQKIYGKLG